MKGLEIEIEGIMPLLMNNGIMCDSENEYVRRIAELTPKGSRKPTDEQLAERRRLTLKGSMYFDKELGPYIPSENIEACIRQGAAKNRKGRNVLSGLSLIELKCPLDYEGPNDQEEIINDERFIDRRPVIKGKGRVIGYRVRFKEGWRLRFTLRYDEDIIGKNDIKKAIEAAGSVVGLGDFRPKYGRFEMIKFEDA